MLIEITRKVRRENVRLYKMHLDQSKYIYLLKSVMKDTGVSLS